jgi:hypothetical protein
MEPTIITIRSIVPVLLAIGLLQPQLARADDHPAARVSFYFAAHEDDWQLFMNPQAFDDVADARTKTVFIHSTAGDAGLGVGTGGRKFPYYLARENGAEAAIRFMADAGRLPADRAAAPMSWPIETRSRISCGYRTETRAGPAIPKRAASRCNA